MLGTGFSYSLVELNKWDRSWNAVVGLPFDVSTLCVKDAAKETQDNVCLDGDVVDVFLSAYYSNVRTCHEVAPFGIPAELEGNYCFEI